MDTSTFICSICGDASESICVYCTKDACSNHLCERCHRCSDCCTCEVRMIDQSTTVAQNGHLAVEEQALTD
jgi:hypothetical protein